MALMHCSIAASCIKPRALCRAQSKAGPAVGVQANCGCAVAEFGLDAHCSPGSPSQHCLGTGYPYKGTLTPVLILQLSFWFLLLDFLLPVFAEGERLC